MVDLHASFEGNEKLHTRTDYGYRSVLLRGHPCRVAHVRIEMKLHMDASRLYSSLRDVSSRCLWDTFCTESMSVRVLSSNLDIIRLQYGDSPHNCLKLLRLHLPFGSSELKFHHRYENSACLVTQSIHSSAGRPAADAACVPLDCKLEEVFRDPSLLEQCAERDALRAASLQAALQNENTATILGSGDCYSQCDVPDLSFDFRVLHHSGRRA